MEKVRVKWLKDYAGVLEGAIAENVDKFQAQKLADRGLVEIVGSKEKDTRRKVEPSSDKRAKAKVTTKQNLTK